MDIDNKDKKILYELEYNSRKPLSKIGQAVKLPKQVVSYRIRKLIDNRVIRSFHTVVDLHRLGHFVYRIYLRFQNVTPKNEDGILQKLANWKNVVWMITTTGRWDAEVVFAARNNIHFSVLLLEIKKEIGNFIKDYQVSFSVVNYHFKRKYLVEKEEEEKIIPRYGFEPPVEKIDETDWRILKYISTNGNASYIEIGNKIGLSYNGVKKRILQLEKRGIIQAYRTLLDIHKLGKQHYKALISLSQFDEIIEKKIISFCTMEPSVVYLIECTGNWDIELEAECSTELEFREMLVRFRNMFKEYVKDYEILHTSQELKLDYFPFSDS